MDPAQCWQQRLPVFISISIDDMQGQSLMRLPCCFLKKPVRVMAGGLVWPMDCSTWCSRVSLRDSLTH